LQYDSDINDQGEEEMKKRREQGNGKEENEEKEQASLLHLYLKIYAICHHLYGDWLCI